MTRLFVAVLALGFGVLTVATTFTTTLNAKADTKVPKDNCVKPCFDCASECLTCMKHSREHKNETMAKECEICANMCLTCYHAVGAKNPRAWDVCELCEKICSDCAAECERGTTDEAKKCAKACRDCVAACVAARK